MCLCRKDCLRIRKSFFEPKSAYGIEAEERPDGMNCGAMVELDAAGKSLDQMR